MKYFVRERKWEVEYFYSISENQLEKEIFIEGIIR
jgi:hypothetical protein